MARVVSAPTPRPTVEPTPDPTPVAMVNPTPIAVPVRPVAQRIAPSGTVQSAIAAHWPGDDRAILCIVRKETGGTFNPMIRSRHSGGKYWGLFQADPDFRAEYGWSGWGVAEQTAMAWRGFQARQYGPWPTRHGCV